MLLSLSVLICQLFLIAIWKLNYMEIVWFIHFHIPGRYMNDLWATCFWSVGSFMNSYILCFSEPLKGNGGGGYDLSWIGQPKNTGNKILFRVAVHSVVQKYSGVKRAVYTILSTFGCSKSLCSHPQRSVCLSHYWGSTFL